MSLNDDMANSWHSGATAFDASGAVIVQQSPRLQTLTNDALVDGEDSNGRKRKRSSAASEHDGRASVDSSSLLGSPLTGKHRHQPGVKRACNDCRQQKVCTGNRLVFGGVGQCEVSRR